jgi:hypothetical protein
MRSTFLKGLKLPTVRNLADLRKIRQIWQLVNVCALRKICFDQNSNPGTGIVWKTTKYYEKHNSRWGAHFKSKRFGSVWCGTDLLARHLPFRPVLGLLEVSSQEGQIGYVLTWEWSQVFDELKMRVRIEELRLWGEKVWCLVDAWEEVARAARMWWRVGVSTGQVDSALGENFEFGHWLRTLATLIRR